MMIVIIVIFSLSLLQPLCENTSAYTLLKGKVCGREGGGGGEKNEDFFLTSKRENIRDMKIV